MAEQKMIRVITPEGKETIVPAANELNIREMYASYPVADQIRLKIEPWNEPPIEHPNTPPSESKATEFQDELAKALEARNTAKAPQKKPTKKQTA